MKNLLLILLLSTFINSWLSEASSAPEPVLDINGKILRTHTTYYIVPTNRENGGLSVETIGNETCQLGVVKEKYDKNGAILEFIPVDKKKGKYFVNVGGVDGNPGSKTIWNWFKIEKYGHGYKFVYCPSVCTYCKVICKDVGVYMINEQNRLALNDVPLVFNFKREFNS
ncbi:miraculin-like [Solanum tuberosum]|uniref:Lemir n=1 Tax=Solanum tuberosum TaxID=4113 RepID=M1CKA4_SOLTU|nr:PREDICTED: miraculin-like [Solanum tuberosum]